MRRALTALFLLATFGLGFLLGPHPCGAGQTHPESAKASCHGSEHAAPAADQQARAGTPEEGDDGTGCDTFCEHACHMTAVAEAGPVVFTISPVSEAVLEPSVSRLSRFVHPIDHIPLV